MKNIISLLRISLGIIFLWYGMLKFFPELSPAEDLAINTINWMFNGLISSEISIKLLALWEVLVGIGFILGVYTRYITILFLIHMVLTFLPLFIFPELSFTKAPYAFTIVGQYIVKNIVFILVGILILKVENEKRLLNKSSI
ncbi:DoxX family protein [Poseidonibacter lekithochrous]|uniref:DoxX family protein n=1 Tax=Poseidonibacter lekithochrous TaxID=1904463 RepID=UPI0008FC7BE7|nr:DoxX family protein [Poseidonibacter lekithochrous]